MPGSSTTTIAPLSTFTTFGDLLKFLRRRARMTQTELSIAVGYSTSQISRLEKNERLPDEATLLAVFAPALQLEKEPETVARLLELVKVGRQEGNDSSASPTPPTEQVMAAPALDLPPLHNLPPRLTSFIGRTQEVAALRQQLNKARLVTLTGVGGVGKTSLALETARSAHFKDGVWLVELAALQDANLIPQLVMDVFKLPAMPGRTPLVALTTYLEHKHLLLLLDNCEHLISACAELVERLLRACPQLHILATSREALNVEGESEWPLTPLGIPDSQTGKTANLKANAIADYEAIALFVARAQTVKPDFKLTEQNALAIVHICSQLDGIPLALELAAARLKGLTVEQLATRLDDRFGLLTSGRRTALPRQQTLRGTIDWSYGLLTEPEKSLFRRLAVFTGGWALEAAEAVAEKGQTGNQTLALLLQLVNKSLVVADERVAETRYFMLETIRQYATEKLWAACEETIAQKQHFAYFLALVEQSHDPTLIGPRLTQWLNRIVVEHHNLRSAFAWAQERDDEGEGLLRLAGGIGLFWILRAGYAEGIKWLETALARGSTADPELRTIVLSRLCDLLRRAGRHKPELVETALTLSVQSNHKEEIGYCLVLKAWGLLTEQSTQSQAIVYLRQALQIFRESGYLLFTGNMLSNVAKALWLNKQRQEAFDLYEECLALGQKYEQITIIQDALFGLFSISHQYGLDLCHKELARQRTQGSPDTIAATLDTLGFLLLDEKQYTEALPILHESLMLWRVSDIKWSDEGGIARTALNLGHNYLWVGDYETAARYMQEAIQVYREVGDIHGVAWAQAALGYIALAQNELPKAVTYFCASLQHSSDSNMNYLPLALCGLAQTHQALGNAIVASRILGATVYFEDKLSFYEPHKASVLKTLAEARAQLTDPVLATAWAEGQAMSIEQAVAYALAVAGDSIRQ
ncbi:MAG: tetratricopeptide repeat protein [Caldilineaceae bacterium]